MFPSHFWCPLQYLLWLAGIRAETGGPRVESDSGTGMAMKKESRRKANYLSLAIRW